MVRQEEFEPILNTKLSNLFRDNMAYVFDEWKKDSPSTYRRMLDHDFGYWKLPKLLKANAAEIPLVEEVYRRNAHRLNEVFISQICVASNYPFMGWLDFCQWIK